MDKKLTNILKYALWTAVAPLLVYFSFRGVDWKDFGAALRGCRWGFVALSMLLGALAYFVRSLRWRMQLLPLDPSTSRVTCLNAYNICMLTNVVLPRVGEIVRCGVVSKHSAPQAERCDSSGSTPNPRVPNQPHKARRLVTFDKALGTVVVDRIWDGLSLLVVLVALLALMWNRFGTFFTDMLFPGISGKAHLWWVLALGVVLAGGFVWLCWRLRERGGLWSRVWGWIRGMYEGLLSCLHMKRGWLFILYTVIIWGLYWLMAASIIWALQGIDPSGVSPEMGAALGKIGELGMADALFLMFAGAVSSLIPVPGGFGAYHGVVAGALSTLYGIPFGVGLVFATLSHESQVIVSIVCGACSYVHETFFRR